MKNSNEKGLSKYQQIALEIANRIAEGELSEGERVFGRSSIAGSFHVSPETARRAFCMLADMGIVFPEKGSGMRVLSKEKAEMYVRQFRERIDVMSIREYIITSAERQKQEMEALAQNLDKLISATENYRSSNLLSPHMIHITENCRFLGKTIEDIRLWQFTGATVVAIRRDGQTMISPGPYAVIRPHDILFFITNDLSDIRVREYLENTSTDKTHEMTDDPSADVTKQPL